MLKSFLMVWRKNIKFSLSDIILKIGGGKFWLKSCRKVPGCQRCMGEKIGFNVFCEINYNNYYLYKVFHIFVQMENLKKFMRSIETKSFVTQI